MANDNDWWARYNAYLESDEWKVKRAAAIRRSGGFCEAELKGCGVKADQAHHVSYRHVFNEPVFELAAVCRSCHEQLTAMDRERRG